MRLFQCLSKKILPKGHLFIGKHHLEYRPDARERDRIQYGLEIEEQNMLYLRHPYLTMEQSRKHMEDSLKRSMKIESIRREKTNNWRKSYQLEDHLNHLRHSEGWE